MKLYGVPAWVIWIFLSFVFLLLGIIVFLIWKYINQFISDKILFVDKNDRWSIYNVRLKGKTKIILHNKTYYLNPEGGILNHRGKALYVFSISNPIPLRLRFKESEWLDSESLTGVINNKMVQKILTPQDSFIDTLLLIGAIGGIIAGISGVIILLMQLGVIKGGIP